MNAYNSCTHTPTHKRIILSKIHLLKRGCAVQFHLLPIHLVHVYCVYVWYECECLYTICVAFYTVMMPALHFHFRLISLPIHCSTRFHQNIYSSNGIWINYSDWWVVCFFLLLLPLLVLSLSFYFRPFCGSTKMFCMCMRFQDECSIHVYKLHSIVLRVRNRTRTPNHQHRFRTVIAKYSV